MSRSTDRTRQERTTEGHQGDGRFYGAAILGVIAAAAALAYSSGFNGVPVFDDGLLLVQSDRSELGGVGLRRIAFWTFALNRAVSLDPLHFRLVNFALHLLSSLAVFFMASMALSSAGSGKAVGPHRLGIALTAAALFALHPVHTNAVTYIYQRMALLSALFSLLALVMYGLAHRSATTGRRAAFTAGAVVSVGLGVLSKENGVLAVPLVFLYDYVFISSGNLKATLKRTLPFALLSVGLTGVLWYLFSSSGTGGDILRPFLSLTTPLEPRAYWTATDVYWSPLQHILTEFRVICRYLLVVLVPLPSLLVFDWWGYPVSTGLFSPPATVVALTAVAAMAAGGLYCVKRCPFLALGMLWFLVALSLETFVSVGFDLYFEYRLYLPMAGLLIGLSGQLYPIIASRIGTRQAAVAAVVVCLALGAATYQRNLAWRDSVTFWHDVTEKVSENIRAKIHLGKAYAAKGEFEKAEELLSASLTRSLEGRHQTLATASLSALGFLYLELDRQDKAAEIRRFMDEKIRGHEPKLAILKGYYSLLDKDFDAASRSFDDVLQGREGKVGGQERTLVLSLRGDLFREKGMPERAAESYAQSLAITPSYLPARHGLAKALLMQGRPDDAEKELRTIIDREPGHPMALADLAYLTLIRGRGVDKALPLAERAVSKDPPVARPHLIMATVLTALGREGEAARYFARARSLGAAEYTLYLNMAWAHSLSGDMRGQKAALERLVTMRDAPEHVRSLARRQLDGLR